MLRELTTPESLAPYFGLRPPHPDDSEPPTTEFRNVLLLGWGGDYEREYFQDCNYTPMKLGNVIAKVDGQTIFKYVNPHHTKSGKTLTSKIIYLT